MTTIAQICAYYSPETVHARLNTRGERLLLEVVRPTLERAKAEYALEGFTFMHFSAQGYHIRLYAYAEEAVLREQIMPLFSTAFKDFFAAHPEYLEKYDEVAPLAQVLNRRLGHDIEQDGLITPGTVMVSYAKVGTFGVSPELEYEHEDVMRANIALQSAYCERLLDLVALEPTMRERMILTRQLLDDMLRLSPLSPMECYMMTQILKLSWVGFFELKPETMQFYRELYEKKADELEAFLSKKVAVETSVRLLPERLRPVYRELAQLFVDYLPRVIIRASGDYTSQDANRMVALFHLLHNRLCLGIEEEVYTAHMLGQHYYLRLSDDERALAEQRLTTLTAEQTL